MTQPPGTMLPPLAGELSKVQLEPPPVMIRISSLGGTRQAHAPLTPRSGSSPGIGLSPLAAPAVVLAPPPNSIMALQTVPALVLACKVEGNLREVRGLCKQARALATAAIDGLTIDCQGPVTEGRMKEVLPLLKACCIKRLCVVLLCEGDGESGGMLLLSGLVDRRSSPRMCVGLEDQNIVMALIARTDILEANKKTISYHPTACIDWF